MLQKLNKCSCNANIAGKESTEIKKLLNKAMKLIDDFEYDEAEKLLTLLIYENVD